MFAHTLFGLELVQHWERWATPLVGFTSAGLIIILVRMFLRQRNLAAPSPPTQQSEPCPDPYEQGGKGERRASLRRGGKAVAVLISDADATVAPFEGWVCDRSLNGLCLEVTRPVEAHTILSVRTTESSISVPWVQLEVKRCERRDENWELGCQFVRTPPYSQLLLFG
jgi:hypothetical protein